MSNKLRILMTSSLVITSFLLIQWQLFNKPIDQILKIRFSQGLKRPALNLNRVYKHCAEESLMKNPGKIHLVTSIIYYADPMYKQSFAYDGDAVTTDKHIKERMDELIYTLQVNLNHTDIGSIHLLLETNSAVRYVQKTSLANKHKLFLYSNRNATIVDSFDFAFECLSNKFVIVVNQDISFANGWQNINVTAIRDNKIGYVLTRHGSPRCPNNYGTCIPQNNGMGAHDAFAFYSTKNYLKADKTSLKNVEAKNFGMENLLAWWMRECLKLKLLNPCQILITHHEHCVPLRALRRDRVNTQHSASISFTDKLL